MNYIKRTVFFLVFPFFVNAQDYVPTTGGTFTGKVVVDSDLTVGDDDWGAFYIDGKGKNNWLFNAHNDAKSLHLRSHNDSESAYNAFLLTINRLTRNIGIGTANPTNKLHVNGGNGIRVSGNEANQMFLTGERTGSTNFRIYDNLSNIYYDTKSNMTFRANQLGGTNGSINLLGGKVGVGTDNPSATLDVNGSLRVNSNSNYTHFRIGKQNNDAIISDNAGNNYYGNGYFFRVHDESLTNKYRDVMMLAENGNVGIGTRTITSRLHVNGDVRAEKEFVVTGIGKLTQKSNDFNMWAVNNIRFGTNHDSTKMSILKNGNVGIGITDPTSKLHIDGTTKIQGHSNNAEFLRFESDRPWSFINNGTDAASRLQLKSNVDSKYFDIRAEQGNKVASFFTSNNINTQKVILVEEGGTVAIGTTDTKGYKLAVDGDVITEEVKVQLSQNWTSVPDYVFKKSYDLATLAEVESYIEANGHLENIPSATEIEKAGGINVGEMNMKLLEKIEELTLYIISQNKQIAELKKDNERVDNLEDKLDAQAKLLELLTQKLAQLTPTR